MDTIPPQVNRRRRKRSFPPFSRCGREIDLKKPQAEKQREISQNYPPAPPPLQRLSLHGVGHDSGRQEQLATLEAVSVSVLPLHLFATNAKNEFENCDRNNLKSDSKYNSFTMQV